MALQTQLMAQSRKLCSVSARDKTVNMTSKIPSAVDKVKQVTKEIKGFKSLRSFM